MRLPHISHVAAYFNKVCISHIFLHKLAFSMGILIILIFFVFLFCESIFSLWGMSIVHKVWWFDRQTLVVIRKILPNCLPTSPISHFHESAILLVGVSKIANKTRRHIVVLYFVLMISDIKYVVSRKLKNNSIFTISRMIRKRDGSGLLLSDYLFL